MDERFIVCEEPPNSYRKHPLWRVSELGHGGTVCRSLPCRQTRADAEQELAEILATPPCAECGEPIGLVEKWYSNGDDLSERGVCFGCGFWQDRVAEGSGIVIGGTRYVDEGRRTLPAGRQHVLGFGGARHRIRMHDGALVETNNLWSNGIIPEHFRDRLPDNAAFEPVADADD